MTDTEEEPGLWMTRRCEWCNATWLHKVTRGRRPVFCTTRCRMAAHRAAKRGDMFYGNAQEKARFIQRRDASRRSK